MASVLVDNATLTGVQRLTGEIPLRSTDVVEADIGALENLLQSILLYDQVIAIDDYKPEFREARKERFSPIRFLDPANFGLPAITDAAKLEADRLKPKIEGGEFVDKDFGELLARLRMHMVCTWDLASSVYYLTMKILGQPDKREAERYKELSAAIFGELQDLHDANGKYDPTVALIDSKGQRITTDHQVYGRAGQPRETGGLTKPLEAFIAALRWLGYRTIYYTLVSEYLHTDLMLYPIRQQFHLNYLTRTQRYTTDFVRQTIGLMNKRVQDSTESIINLNRPSAIAFDLPIFSAWLVRETKDVRLVLSKAMELQDDPDLVSARTQLGEIRVLLDKEAVPDAYKKVNRMIAELDKIWVIVRRRFGVRTSQGITLATAVQVTNPMIQMAGGPRMPEMGKTVQLLPQWLVDRWPRRGVGALYRDISRDLSDFARLGKIRDMLGAAVDTETLNATSYDFKVEDPRYRNSQSSWKIPM